MDEELIDKLTKIEEVDEKCLELLNIIYQRLQNFQTTHSIKKLSLNLFSLACQNKQLTLRNHYKKNDITINNIKRPAQEFCLDSISQILIKLIAKEKQLKEFLSEFFLDHIEAHPFCLSLIIVFYKLVFFSSPLLKFLKKENYLPYFIELFERTVLNMLKNHENPERYSLLLENYKSSQNQPLLQNNNPNMNIAITSRNSEFQNNLCRFLSNLNSPLQTPKTIMESFSNLTIFSPASSDMHNQDLFDNNNYNNIDSDKELNSIKSPSKVSSLLEVNLETKSPLNLNTLNLESNSTKNANKQIDKKNLKIPLLHIPTNITENYPVISRSTRRADPYKSLSSHSNRFGNSVEYAKNESKIYKNSGDNNFSLMEDGNSLIFDENYNNSGIRGLAINSGKNVNELTANEKMKLLANQLGEYCLTVDLGCLLAQKRKHQLDQVAKIAVFEEVDSLMDIKIDKNTIKRKINQNKHDFVRERPLIDKPNFIDSIEIKDMNESQDISITSLKSNEFRMGSFVNKERKSKKELKSSAKLVKILSNLIYLILKEYKINELNFVVSPINIIYMYLTSGISANIRKKEITKMAFSKNGWSSFHEIDFELSKIKSIADGFDNQNKINRHYQKTIFQQYNFSKNIASNDLNKNMKKDEDIQNPPDNSTLLYFSNFLDNSEDSFGSMEEKITKPPKNELVFNEKNFLIENLMLPESLICFKILDLFSILSEKTHENLCCKVNDRQINTMDTCKKDLFLDLNSVLDKNCYPSEIIDITTEKSDDLGKDEILIRGVPLQPLDDNRDIKKNSNNFLTKFKKKFTWFFNNMDMNSQSFFELETQQFEILEKFLFNSTSRIISYEFLDYFLDILFMIKRQFVELSFSVLVSSNDSTARINTPNLTKTDQLFSNLNLKKLNGSANIESQGEYNNENFMSDEKNNSKLQTNDLSSSLILKYPDCFGVYLQIIARIILKARKFDVYNLMNKLYISNEVWNDLLKIYCNYMFNELLKINEKENSECQENLFLNKTDSSSVYLNCQRIMFYYKSICVMCQNIIHKESTEKNDNQDEDKKNEWKNIIRKILQSMQYLIRCGTNSGLIPRFLNLNVQMNSLIISPETEESPEFIIKFNLFKEIFQFVNMIFSFNEHFSCFLNDEISSFYIRYSYINFVKLYSYSSNHELNEINSKINELRSKVNESVENFEFPSKRLKKTQEKEKGSIEKDTCFKTKFKNDLIKLYIKCLFAFSLNRTDEITKKFYQYRIVEFLTREIDLEFEITQIRERFLRIRNETKKQVTETDYSMIQTETKQIPLENARKSLPSLNLEGPGLNALNIKQTSGSTKAKVPTLNLNSGFKINNLEVNKSYKNQEAVNESIDKKQIIENEAKVKKMPLMKKLDLGGILSINNKDNSPFINNLNNSQIKNIKEDSSGAKEGEESKTTKEEKKHNPLSNILKKTDQDWVEKMKKEKSIIDSKKQSKSFAVETNINKIGHNVQNETQIMNDSKISNNSKHNLNINTNESLIVKKKVAIPFLKLPMFKPGTPKVQQRDDKYAGPEDEKSQEKPKIKRNMKIPTLKIDEINYEKNFKDREEEKLKEFERNLHQEGNLTKLEQSLNKSNKMQLILEGSKIKNEPRPKNHINKPNPSNLEEFLTENTFYYSERRLRKIYDDNELHVIVLSLIISLLLTPSRGVLDDLYCSQYPINNGKPNILYLLHFHLNHPSNQHILPLLLSKMAEVSPYPSGQRLLKLLCTKFSNLENYTNPKKLATGAYGTVFEYNTNLSEPKTVAIKQLSFPKSIYDRCVLHDIFTEITSLEHFKLEPWVTDMYDYGVTDNDYFIVMKKYPCSLKEWRVNQKRSWQEYLPLYLTIYRDILKSVKFLHDNNVIHYDIKADNILLDTRNSNGNIESSFDSEFKVTLADFGECRMFVKSDDEYCLRNRGTEYIKSPEMLTLTINSKKEGDKYDRRKKIGTTRSSDVWSLGCLLYELLSGEFLFYHNDWVHFYIRVTSPNEVLLTSDKLEKIDNNVYIIDFLKYILVRDPQHRPNIDGVLKRFEHIHGLLVSNNPMSGRNFASNKIPNNEFQNSLEFNIDSYVKLIKDFFKNFNFRKETAKLHHCPKFLKIVEEICLCSNSYFQENVESLISNGVTHIVALKGELNTNYFKRFRYLLIDTKKDEKFCHFPLSIKILDFLKEIFLYRGKVAFVENNDLNDISKNSKVILRVSLLYCLSYFFKSSVYETLNLLNSQILFYFIPFSCFSLISGCMSINSAIEQYISTFPKIQCICGCCTILLKRQFNIEKNIIMKPCKCSRDSASLEISDCPSDGCTQYLSYIKNRYKINWETIKWGYFDEQDFLVGPSFNKERDWREKLMLNSQGIEENSQIYHKNLKDNNLFSKMSSNLDDWKIFECKTCHMWLYAQNSQSFKIVVILNNAIKRGSKGIMNMPSKNKKAYVLRNFNLYELR